MNPDNKIIDLPVRNGRAGGRERQIGPAQIIIFPGVRIDRGGDHVGRLGAGPMRRWPAASAHAMDEDQQ
jgi:hypothetical protein